MKAWPTLQQLLSESLATFLARALPEVGGDDWWFRYVLECLTPAQARSAEGLAAGDLRAFDLAALLRVADRNWAEVALKLKLRREGRTLVIELKDVRNRYAHASLRGVDLDDQLRDVDTVKRLMQAIGAAPESIAQVNAIHRRLLLEVAGAQPGADGDDEGAAAPPMTGAGGPPEIPLEGLPKGKGGKGTAQEPPAREPDSDDAVSVVVDAPAAQGGGWMVNPASPGREVQRALEARTYLGIDFGTSTTVVSVVRLEGQGLMASRTLAIAQPAELGGKITHHLVNTVLAWQGGELFFGSDAYRLRQELFEGRNVFSSFKMRLGVDVGPTYPDTALPRGAHQISIEDANDATREFFKMLRVGIEEAVRAEGLPTDLRMAVSVPASFEANQRRDLLRNMKDAGLPADEICLIDEPNAAFLSFLHASALGEADRALLDRLRESGANVLVYDFGAGTCDVSVLNVRVGARGVSSRNLAISRFTALGGDDIDRAIAKHALLPQLLAADSSFDPEQRDTEERLIPRLQPTAERLKLAAIDWLSDRGVSTLQAVKENAAVAFSDHALPPFKIRGHSLSLAKPSMTLGQLAEALEPFVGRYDPDVSTMHVFAPVVNAIEKSGLDADQLDAVLFIGGSAANPIVRTAVMNHLPGNVKAIVPPDLRSHVSLGAALHSLGFHAFGMDLIRPITSESIYVIARGGRLETVIPAAAEVPTPEPFVTRMRIDRTGQTVVELPICVGAETKLLGLLRIQAPTTRGFTLDEEIIVSASITHDKLLDVQASVAGVIVRTGLLNPLANGELTPAQTRMLEAKQHFNQALLASRGRPSKEAVLNYAKAAMDAEAFDLAAEMYVATERIDPAQNHATSICYAYYRAGRPERSKEWGRRAYERRPDAVAAYNLSCDAQGEEQERLLNESLKLNGELACALLGLGRLLRHRNDPQGVRLLEKAIQLMQADLRRHALSKEDCRRLVEAARDLGQEDLADQAQARLESLLHSGVYEENNLAAPIQGQRQISRG